MRKNRKGFMLIPALIVAFNTKTGNEIITNNIRQFVREYGLDRRTVQRCLKGNSRYSSHKGWTFSYAEQIISLQQL